MVSGCFYRVRTLGGGGAFFQFDLLSQEKNSFEAAIPPGLEAFFV